MKNKEKQDRHLTIRMSNDLYQSYVEKALKMGQKEQRIVKISEVIKTALENGK